MISPLGPAARHGEAAVISPKGPNPVRLAR